MVSNCRGVIDRWSGIATRVATDASVGLGYAHSYWEMIGEARLVDRVSHAAEGHGFGIVAWVRHPRKAKNVDCVGQGAHEHVGQGCVLASPAFERISRPSLVDGRRAPALRFGDPRVQALAGALAITAHLIGGFSNKSLRPLVGGLLDEPYSQARCCYDLRRLKLKGLIVRLEHSNTYVLTDDGQRFAVFYTKVHNRLLRPLLAADQPPAPLEVRQALKVLDHAVTDYIDHARIAA